MHIFINDLIDIGVQNFVVRYIPDECIKANFLIVKDTLIALQLFAAYYRNFSFPIGLTGVTENNCKEWLNFL
jgi:alanine racemase